MTIPTILEELSTSEKPVAKVLHKSDSSRTVCIGFNKGMQLKEHKTTKPTTLLVLNGSIEYTEGEEVYNLSKYDQYEIPPNVVHAVNALEDSLIMLMHG
ncbi:MAG: hypothetical protein RIM99_18665 [Cyclobacteriaceae bacterium]